MLLDYSHTTTAMHERSTLGVRPPSPLPTALRAWCKQYLPGHWQPDVLRPGIVGMRRSCIISVQPQCCMQCTCLLSFRQKGWAFCSLCQVASNYMICTHAIEESAQEQVHWEAPSLEINLWVTLEKKKKKRKEMFAVCLTRGTGEPGPLFSISDYYWYCCYSLFARRIQRRLTFLQDKSFIFFRYTTAVSFNQFRTLIMRKIDHLFEYNCDL